MELRSGSISGKKTENPIPDSNIEMEMIEDIWMEIEKRVSMFFLEEQKSRRELLNELTTMREENSKLREDINNLKVFISSEVNLKDYIADREAIVANGNVVANENVNSITARDRINVQLTEVRNALKNKYYKQRTSERAESIHTNDDDNDNQLSVKSVDPTVRAIETPERTTTPSIEVPKPNTAKQDINKSQWPAGTTLVVGDSMLGGIDESRIGPKRKVRSFPGATIEDMHQYIVPLLRKHPTRVIAHVGTNDATFSDAKKIAEDLFKLQQFIISHLPDC